MKTFHDNETVRTAHELRTPLHGILGLARQGLGSVSTMALFAVAPFNLLKGTLVSVLTFLLYKRIERVLFKKAPQ